MLPPLLNVSSGPCIFKCVSPNRLRRKDCTSHPSPLDGQRLGLQVRNCLPSAQRYLRIPSPEHPLCPGVRLCRKLWGFPVMFTAQLPGGAVATASCWEKLGQASDMPHVRITLTEPLITARFPPSGVFAIRALPACLGKV